MGVRVRREPRFALEKLQQIGLGLIVISLAVFLFAPSPVREAYENVSFYLLPSSEKAMAFGDYHFDSQNPRAYDLNRAEYFYLQATRLEPRRPYLYHQLARISFLRGQLHYALGRINIEIAWHGEKQPNTYYVRGLIEGFLGKYDDAIQDYTTYVRHDPTNWAATNDLAWVLLKADRPQEAIVAIDKVLPLWRDNAWLLNNKATALYELGLFKQAHESAKLAALSVAKVTEREWAQAYPGNDPLVAKDGLAAFQAAVYENEAMIQTVITRKAESRK